MFIPICTALWWSVSLANDNLIDLPRQHHPWGKFKPGSWVERRETTFTRLAGKDQPTSFIVTRMELQSAGERGFSLETTVATPQAKVDEKKITTMDWDELPLEYPRSVRVSVGEIKIAGKSFACQTHEIVATAPNGKWTTKLWYSPDQPPFVLKCLRRFQGEEPRFHAWEITDFNVFHTTKDKRHPCYLVHASSQDARFLIKETQYHSHHIPGGLIHAHKEIRDKQLEKSTISQIELEDYRVAP